MTRSRKIVARTLLAVGAGLLLALAAALVGIATISLGHHGPPPLPAELYGRREMRLAGAGELRAGAARVELVVPSRGPIAGYPAYRRDDGSGEPIFVRALFLEQGELHAVLLSLPLLLVPGELEEEIARRAALGTETCLLVAATHTHSGPGGTWDNPLVALGGNGLFDPLRADAVAQAAEDAIALARERLLPARLSAGVESWTAGPAVPRSGLIDPALGAARLLDGDGRTLASLLVYGMHATVIPRSAHGLDGDWPEAAAQALEQASGGAPALVLQGAGGNATFLRVGLPDDPRQAARQLGARVAAEASRLLSGAPLFPADAPLACSTRLVALPEPRAGLSLFKPVRRAAGNLLRLFAGRAAIESGLELPGLLLQGVPGEPSGELGLAWHRARGERALLVGLADGYAGYVESAARWLRGEGESSRTWYGPQLAAALGIEPGAQGAAGASGAQQPLLNRSQ